MHNRSDQFAKNMLRDVLSLVSASETEVEVLAATQKIDVYASPDPARAAERKQLGLLGELSAEPTLFEAFSNTPGIDRARRCLNKQLTWHHELERRARVAAGKSADDFDAELPAAVMFPWLVIVAPGRPEAVLGGYGCREVCPGLYEAVAGLRMRVVVVSELPRSRETLMLRLLGRGRVLVAALADLKALPADAWERSIATPLLVHFRFDVSRSGTNEEEDVSAEIRAWFQDYERKLRYEGQKEGLKEGRKEGRKEGECDLLVRQLRGAFGELPAWAMKRIKDADVTDIERWGLRLRHAQTLAEVFDDAS